MAEVEPRRQPGSQGAHDFEATDSPSGSPPDLPSASAPITQRTADSFVDSGFPASPVRPVPVSRQKPLPHPYGSRTMSQDQTALLLDALRQRIEELNRLSTELHLYGGTGHAPDVWLQLHSSCARALEVTELGLRSTSSPRGSSTDPCRCPPAREPGPPSSP